MVCLGEGELGLLTRLIWLVKAARGKEKGVMCIRGVYGSGWSGREMVRMGSSPWKITRYV